ncbi:hypothetical protein V6L77_22300 [Pannonibacter sp. Pt2-lr]
MFRQVMMATALMAANVAPALAEMIVVAASGDAAFHPGDRIAEGTSLQLPEGARLTFLFKSGEMKVISGPFEGNIAGDTPAAAPISTWETIKSFSALPNKSPKFWAPHARQTAACRNSRAYGSSASTAPASVAPARIS